MEGKPTPNGNGLAEPFSQIFTDRDEADWAFGLLRDTVKRLQITGAYDERVAVILTRRGGRPALHLNFGAWLVLGFRGPGARHRVDMALLADQVAWDEQFITLTFEPREGEREVRRYELPIELVRPMPSHLRQAYETTLDFIASKFQNWKRTPHRQHHKPELIEAFFDPERRDRLYAGALVDPDLLYEPTRRVFELELAEEEGEYGVEGEQGSRGVGVYRSVGVDQNLGLLEEATLQEFAEDITDTTDLPPLLPHPPAPLPPYPLPQLAEDTGFDQAELERWLRALERKKQVILYGPPGTGKTYVAERLARHLVGGTDGFMELVQFHPAYAYEDFMQGLRPQALAGGGLAYPLVPGRFLAFCRQAEGRQGPCVLIVDEINRADLARVFGELMYLLEYRDRAIPLAGGGDSFHIPGNVRLIGTMNTADRSIALVDHALRRRFAFLALRPDYELLRHYHRHEATGFEVEGLIKLLKRLNKAIGDPHYEVGVTFFLNKELAANIEDIWRMEIEPYLEEYFFDQPAQVEAFRWEGVKQEIERA